jgi:hypothetical protein
MNSALDPPPTGATSAAFGLCAVWHLAVGALLSFGIIPKGPKEKHADKVLIIV